MSENVSNDKLMSGEKTSAVSTNAAESPGLDTWLTGFLADDDMLNMGHEQRREDHNLGMGWLYYGLARLIRPTNVVVIGSWRGFSPMIFAKAVSDNVEGGRVTFIDPGLVDDTWSNPDDVQRRFLRFGLNNIDHHHMTTQQFIKTQEYRSLGEVGILFVDGDHTEAQARFDYEAFADRVPPHGIALFHDSVLMEDSRIYGEERRYRRTVKLYLDHLKADPSLQVFDVPFCHGVTLVRRIGREGYE